MNKIRLLVFLLTSLTFGLRGYSQGEANVWYVGSNIKMDFSGGGDPQVSEGILTTANGNLTENSTAISNPQGELLFAAVGSSIYDGDQKIAAPLPANTWNVSQGTIVFPVPGVDNKYYLSVMKLGAGPTTPNASYYEVTVTGTGANNVTVSAAKDLLPNLTQAQAGIPKINADFSVSDDYWLVTHEKCNNNFQIFSVTSSGITKASTQATGPDLVCKTAFPEVIDEIGIMKFNNCYTQMAYTIGGKVHLYDFDAITGTLTFVNEVTSLSSDQPYGTEFSSDGSFLYVLTGQDNNHPGKIYSIPVGVGGLGTATLLGATGGMRGGHLQMGPDGNIYYAAPKSYNNNGTGFIGRITDVDNGGKLNNEFYAAVKQNDATGTGFNQWVDMDMPTFLKSLVSSIATLKVNGKKSVKNAVCVGETVDFGIDIGGQDINGVEWKASGSNTKTQSNGEVFQITMTNAGQTDIDVDVEDDCGRKRSLHFEVTVGEYVDADADVDKSTCPNQTLVGKSTNSSVENFEWFDGDPNNGGKLISFGPEYQYTGTGDVWIQAAIVGKTFTDSRSHSNWGFLAAAGTKIEIKNNVHISEAKFYAYSNFAPLSGQWSVTLQNSKGETIGSPATGNYKGSNTEVVTVKGTGWVNLPPDTYTMKITSATNNIATVSGAFDGGGIFNADGGNLYGFKVQEATPLTCVTPKKVDVGSCCKQPANVTVSATKEDICAGQSSDLKFTVNYDTGDTPGDFTAFWVKDGSADPLNGTKVTKITGLTGADAGEYTYVVVDKAFPTQASCSGSASITIRGASATVAAAGDDVTDLCTEEYDLQGNAPATGETGKWTVKSGSGNFADDTNPTTKVTGLGVGDNVFVWTITGSCTPSTDEVKITRLEPIAGGSLAAVAPTKVDICSNTSDHAFEVTGITGTNPVYNWTMPTGVTQNGSGASIKINVGNVTAATSDKLQVSVTGDCPGKVDLDITLNWDATPDVSKALITAIDPVCVNNTGQQKLEVTGIVGTVDEYGWSATDPANPTNLILLTGTSNPLNAQLTQQITFAATEASKTITIRVQAQNACGTSVAVEGSAKIDNLPTEATVSSPTSEVCIVEKIFLTGNTPGIGTGKWVTQGASTGGMVADENDGGSELTGLTGGQVYSGKWVISNGVCPDSEASVTVKGQGTVNPKISFNITPSNKVCEGTEVTLEAVGENGGNTPIYEFLDGSGTALGGSTSDATTDFKFTPTVGDTDVQVRFTSSSSCVDKKDPITAAIQTITVEAAPKGLSITKPVPSSGDVFETCETTVALEATATAGTVSWNITPISGTGTITDNGSGKADVTGIPEGTTIEVQAVSSSGTTCTAITETVKIEVKGKITPAKLEDDYAICISDAGTVNIVNLSGTLKTGETDSWAPGDGDTHLTITNGSVSGLKVGTNKIKYSVDNGLCPTSTDEIIITVDELPQAPTVTDISTCDSKIGLNGVNPNTSLDGQNPGSAGVWSWEVVTPLNGGTITDPTDPLSEITSLATNGNNKTDITVKATITNGECSISEDMVISQLGTIPDISFSYQGTDYTDGKIENGSPQTIRDLCVNKKMSLNVSGPDADHVGTWTVKTGDASGVSLDNNVATKLDINFFKVGTYELEYVLAKKSDAACNANATLTVVSLDVPVAPTKSGTDPAPICEGSDITFTVNTAADAESYEWSNDFGLANNGTSNNEDYTFPSEANGTVTVFAKNICGNSTGSVSYNVEVVSPAAITINGVISELCAEGNKAPQNLETLSSFSGKASSGVSNNYTNTYMWYDDATNAVINQTSYPVTGAATIRVEGTNTVCTTPVSKTTSFQTINPTIILEDEYELTRVDGDRKLICLSSKATTPFLKDIGAGTGTYEWEVYGVPQPPTTNQLFLEGALIDGLFEEQAITVTKIVPGCSEPFGPVTVNVYSIPESNPKLEFVSERKYVCADDESAGNKVSLQVVDLGISTSGHYITSYTWNTGQTGKIEEINKGGDYYVDVNHIPSASLGFNATDVEKAKVCNNPTPTLNVPSYDVSVAIEEIEPIDAQNGDESTNVNVIPEGTSSITPSYIWTVESHTGKQVGFGETAEITLEHMPSTGIIYLTSKYEECTATNQAPILVYEEVAPPNVFTPNGDGQHDTWKVPGLETYPDAVVTIYNRWGNIIYQTFGGYDADREWDGKNQNTGADVTIGAFYYVIELNVEGRKQITGHINVLR